MDKQHLVDRILQHLNEEMATLAAAIEVSKENATSVETKTEGQYDTRALESSYLADGQRRRMAELHVETAACRSMPTRPFAPGEPAALGALVEVEMRGGRDLYLLAPCAGGMEIACDGRTVLVVTPQSPLGHQLLGGVTGGTVRLDAAREMRIVGVM